VGRRRGAGGPDAGVDLVVGDSDEECSADVVYRSLEYDFSPLYEELAAVTRDHDLWLREDPRSDDLADYAYWTDPAEYVEVVREYGVDLPPSGSRTTSPSAASKGGAHRSGGRPCGTSRNRRLHGRDHLRPLFTKRGRRDDARAGADASVIVKPAGSASIRGTDEFELCHEVAGRSTAAATPRPRAAKPDIYDDMLDYANHWTTRGAVTKRVILDAFRDVVDEADEATDGDADTDASED